MTTSPDCTGCTLHLVEIARLDGELAKARAERDEARGERDDSNRALMAAMHACGFQDDAESLARHVGEIFDGLMSAHDDLRTARAEVARLKAGLVEMLAADLGSAAFTPQWLRGYVEALIGEESK